VKLAAYRGQSNFFSILRDLTVDEIQNDKKYKPVVADARERLKLFKILAHNYQEWSNYITSLLSPRAGDREDEMLHLDRLLLNYLNCAYTLRKHFAVLFKHRFAKDSHEQKAYMDFLERLSAHSWAVAFFMDFRGYVQHRGLGIGHYDRRVSDTSVQLTITCDAKILVAESRDWKRSKLSESKGIIDLVPLLRDFHAQMLTSYAAFISKTLFPLLTPAADFYEALTKEVQQTFPQARMVFSPTNIEMEKVVDKTHYNFNMIQVPNDLFAELGISMPKIDERGWLSLDFSRL